MTLDELFSRSIPEPNSGCWLWLGHTTAAGYGAWRERWGRKDPCKHHYAHRDTYEAVKGTIPAGLEIDHLCRVRCCINPDHLEAVTHQENTRRGEGASGTNVRKTHCPSGHPYSAENTIVRITERGGVLRRCRVCYNTQQRAAGKKRRAK